MDMETNETGQAPASGAPTLLVVGLGVLAVMAPLVGLAVAVVIVMQSPQHEGVDLLSSLEALAWILAGGGASLALGGLGWLIQRRHVASLMQQRILGILEQSSAGVVSGANPLPRPSASEPGAADSDAESTRGKLLQRVLCELTELNANLMMTEEQRQAKGVRERTKIAEQLSRDFDRSLDKHDFAQSRRLLEQFERQLFDEPFRADMARRLTEARESAQTEDLRRQTRRAEDLMAVSSFDEARKVAAALAEQYPQSSAARDLAEKVQREATIFQQDHCKRLYSQVQRRADARQWHEALEAAGRLVQAYPASAQADAVNAMMPTIEENARIEEVRSLRDRIRDMIQRRRYAEAVELSLDVLERFPDTQAATDLRSQIDRLKTLAEEQTR